ncbi:MAG: hypothetical protein BV459_06110 [Thermoplasmata archaeon M11B2D]|nr:MAG: hypothetical protein BV459_06110 [Thermoplasmata archaeon M11B2D]
MMSIRRNKETIILLCIRAIQSKTMLISKRMAILITSSRLLAARCKCFKKIHLRIYFYMMNAIKLLDIG